jgi:MYXO-CTERM domain-containing protein
MLSSSRLAVLAFAAVAASSSFSFAALIAPGGFIPSTVGAPPDPATLVFSSPGTFVGKDSVGNTVFTGSEVSSVYADPANPLGGLTFTYTVSNDLTSPDAMERVSVSNFLGFLTDVVYSGPGDAPLFFDRTNADVVGFDFFGVGIPQGTTTSTLIIRTNATTFTASTLSVIDGGTGVVASVGPVPTGGPEPASLGILGAGALLMLRRRR